jgi:virginiamycin B lyase
MKRLSCGRGIARSALTKCAFVLVSIAAATIGSQPAVAAPLFTEYPVPTPAASPCNTVAGPDHAVWFAELSGNKIGRLDPATGAISEFPIPSTLNIVPAPSIVATLTSALGPVQPLLSLLIPNGFVGALQSIPFPVTTVCGIDVGPDNAIWFNEPLNDRIARIDITTHQITEYTIPTRDSLPMDLAAGPDNAIWFVETAANKIGRFDLATQQFSEYPVPTPLALPIGMFAGPDGGMWFPEFTGNKIGRLDMNTHVITEYPVPTPLATPFVLRAVANGALWFTEMTGNKIGRLDLTTHAITEFTIPTLLSAPISVTYAPDGFLYFDESIGNKIGRMDPVSSAMSEYPIPTLASYTDEIHIGPDGNVWFPEWVGNKIGTLNLNAVDSLPGNSGGILNLLSPF